FIALRLVLSPSDHRGQKVPLIKHMDIEVAVTYPGQAGYVKVIGWLALHYSPEIPVFLPILQKTGVELRQVLSIGCDQLGEVSVLRMEVGVAGRDKVPTDQVSICIPAILELLMGIDHPRHHPNHGRIELHAVLFYEPNQRRHVHIHRQAHDNPHVIHIEPEQIASWPSAEINHFVIHLNTPLHDYFFSTMQGHWDG